MFKNSIPGLDKVFRTDIEPPKVVLITGPPGSMKTSFCYSLMSSSEEEQEFGLCINPRGIGPKPQSMRSLGMKVVPTWNLGRTFELDGVVESTPRPTIAFVGRA
jgi:hypothetical protein